LPRTAERRCVEVGIPSLVRVLAGQTSAFSLADTALRLKSGCTAIDATGRGAQNWSNSAAIIGSLESQVGLAPTFCYWEI
jgi:hypothetical protein